MYRCVFHYDGYLTVLSRDLLLHLSIPIEYPSFVTKRHVTSVIILGEEDGRRPDNMDCELN